MSFGLMFIAVNLVYLLFSVTIGVIVLIILEKKSKWTLTKRLSISTGIFLFVLILPFYDLLIQKAIKTYYETFKRNDTVYSYPEKDKNGKIESLNNTSSFSYVNGFLMFDESYKTFLHSFNNVSDFVEIKLLL
ncbi:hypothetical protein KKA17_11575, partial [bacterium]|nr:hypothetical protein [bacterium]MBU1883651.1 hypothetical protein [bacterium]